MAAKITSTSQVVVTTALLLMTMITMSMGLAQAGAGEPTGGDPGSSNCTSDEPYVAPLPFKGCRLQYYVQVLVGDPSLNQMLLPPLNTSYTGLFGHGELFAFNVTSGPERTSRLLGYARGFTIDSSYRLDLSGNSIDLIEVEYVSYDDGVYKGTFQIQGEILAQRTNEVAIIGGTGSFRGARGYAFISRLLLDGNYRLFHHDVRFLH